jgi:8-oxo-dGTP pyrophosphatase MutT (NUDIX family)
MAAQEIGSSRNITEKAVAYITHADRLLVFSHPNHPEAGIQVPAGTVKGDESPEEAVIREAHEETGLEGLVSRGFLGVHDYEWASGGRAHVQRRYYFHLELRGHAPDTWRHYETDPSDGSPGPIALEFFWARFPEEVPALAGGQGDLLPQLVDVPRPADAAE